MSYPRNAICVGFTIMTLAGGWPQIAVAGESECQQFQAPVVSLSYGSRYQDNDSSRSLVDENSNAEVNKALKPVDDFIRDLVQVTNASMEEPNSDTTSISCAITAIADWADAEALSELDSFTANLSVGARVAGIAIAYEQAVRLLPPSEMKPQRKAIEAWLVERSLQQIDFWEKDATTGARSGNLRAWASLAVLVTGDLTQNDYFKSWAKSSTARILCSAREDGSLPQETKRGKYALHYQLHAVAPLSLISARLQEGGVKMTSMCSEGLRRVVNFALTDLQAGGRASEGYSGKAQSLFEENEGVKPHMMAWLPAYLSLFPEDTMAKDALAAFKPVAHSKMGGRQDLIWGS